LTEALPTGVAAGSTLIREDLDRMIEGYYQARRWTRQGKITRETWERLGLERAY
jgi:aldehyde:ferredoxin oxidoreductase